METPTTTGGGGGGGGGGEAEVEEGKDDALLDTSGVGEITSAGMEAKTGRDDRSIDVGWLVTSRDGPRTI
jgi:hypothetical protein